LSARRSDRFIAFPHVNLRLTSLAGARKVPAVELLGN